MNKIMTNDEMYDMIIMCAQACRESKDLQIFDSRENTWSEARMYIHLIVNAIVCDGCKFRVKPEPKTVRMRWYWINVNVDEIYVLDYAQDELCDEVNIKKHHIGFHSWAGDEQILIVPGE